MDNSPPRRGRFSNLFNVGFLFLGATLLLTSCSKKASTAIIGKWRVQSTRETVEFRKDGTLTSSQETIAGPPGGNAQTITNETTGKYTFTDSGHMNVQINTSNTNQPTISATCEVRVDGDKMRITMTIPGERQPKQTSFKRVR
jgi:hypothetical protein